MTAPSGAPWPPPPPPDLGLPPPPPAAPRPSRARGVALCVLVGGALVGGGAPAVASALRRPITEAVLVPEPMRSCAPIGLIGGGMGAGAISADISGDGCPERLVVSGAIVVAPGIAAGGDRRASLAGPGPSGAGRPRSALLVGDWACSGALGPAWRTPYDGSMRTWRSWAALVNGDAPTIITGPPGDGPLTVVAPRAGRCAVVRTASNALGGAPRSHPQATLGNDTP